MDALDGPLPVPSVSDRDTADDHASSATPAASPAVRERYTLLDEIAHGGMGTVYRAADAVLGREVAVKVLQEKYGPDSGTARRFADEARITAQLQHPAIPPVHDLGALPDGRPFLAMKLIKGQTLERLLAARPDVAAERGRFVAVFEQVCQALAFAHSHHVIHRDLKPANVMVGAFGEVQVMDWGLAKVLTEHAAEITSPEETTAGTQVVSLRDSDGPFTQAGSVLGTPAYMPPEQAIGAVGKVDRRSDVFGLGAILAVILTGRPPYDLASGETARVKAAQGDVADCLARLDACGAEPELVALCKRCLSPRPEDRPADAAEVARTVAELRAAADERARRAELERVKAEGDKVAAQLQAAEQRKRRWVQAALGLTFTAAVVLVVAGLWWADRQRADQARVEGERAAERAAAVERARQAVKAALVLAADLRDQFRYDAAVKALDEAAELIPPGAPADIRANLDEVRGDTLLVRDLEEISFSRIRSDPVAGTRGMASAYRAAFAKRGYDPSGPDPAAANWAARSPERVALAVALTEWAVLEPDRGAQARLLVVARRADPSEWADRLRDPARWWKDAAQRLAAETSIRDLSSHHLVLLLQFCHEPWPDARRVLLAEAARRRSDFWAQFEIGYFFIYKERDYRAAVGPLRAALALRPDCAYALNLLASALRDSGDTEAALAEYQAEQDMFQRRADASPDVTQFQLDLAESQDHVGSLLARTGKPDEALKDYQQARDIRQRLAAAHPGDAGLQRALADCRYRAGLALADGGNRAEGVEELTQARDLWEKLAAARPDDAGLQVNLADCLYHVGILLADGGKRAEGVAALSQARDIRQKLAAARPDDADNQSGLAWCHYNLAMVLADAGRPDEALREHQQARDIRQRLAAARPDDADLLRNLALSHASVGDLLWRNRKPDEAMKTYEQARDIRQKLADAKPAVPDFQLDLAQTLTYVGNLLRGAGKSGEALKEYEQARDVRQRLADANPAVAQFQGDLAASLADVGGLLLGLGKPEEARRAFEQIRDVRQRLADANPNVAQLQDDLAASHDGLGIVLLRCGKPAEALKEQGQARDIRRKLADANPANPDFQAELARGCHSIGQILLQIGKPADALQEYERARDLLQKLADANATTVHHDLRYELAVSQRLVGDLLVRTRKPAEALQALEQARDGQQRLVDAHPANSAYLSELAASLGDLGRLQAHQGRLPEAFASLDAGLALRQKLADIHSGFTRSLGSSYADRGGAHVLAGHPAEAAADLRHAIELWDKDVTPDAEMHFARSRALALLAGLAKEPKAGVTADEAAAYADRAVAALRAAAGDGWADPDELKDPDFDALRQREDFQKLMKELEAKDAGPSHD